MFSITPLGSCRIATPLKLCSERYGYTINRSRSYGFSHSSAEVVQQLRFMKGEITPPPEVWPFIARQVDRDDLMVRVHVSSHLYMVEISSAKQIELDGWLIQLNYLTSQLSDFFASKERGSAYWRLIDEGNQAQIDAFLSDAYSETPEQIEDAQILRRIRRSMTSDEELKADISYLIETLENVLFVTHVNAIRPDGTPIPSREALIDRVERTVRACNGIVYNPTARMNELTQIVAIEDYSDSLAHFTPQFSQVIVDDWFANDIKRIIDATVLTAGGEDQIAEIYKPHFEALVVNGLFEGLDERLDQLIAAHPGSPTLLEMSCKLCMSQNKLEKARNTAVAMVEARPGDLNLLSRYADIALELGDFTNAASVYARLLDQGHPVHATRLHDFGQLAERDGQVRDAVRFYEMALMFGGNRPNAVADLGNVLIAHGDVSLWETLSPDAQMTALKQFDPYQLMEVAKLVGTDFLEYVTLDGLSADDLAAYARKLNDTGRVEDASDMISQWRTINDADTTHPDLRAIIEQWFQASEAAEELEQKIALLSTVLRAQPNHGSARVAIRDIRREALAHARTLAGQKDREALETLATQTQALPYDLPELALYRARLAFEAQDYQSALEIGQVAVKGLHDNVSLWTLLMRSALQLGDYVLTDYFADQVIAHADAATERLEEEAVKRRERTPLLCYRAARDETDPLQLVALYRIASRHEEYGKDAARKCAASEVAVINELRKLQIANDPAFETYLANIQDVMGTNPKVLLSAGRYFVKNKDFTRAADYWTALTQIDPANEEAEFQKARCLERLSTAVAS